MKQKSLRKSLPKGLVIAGAVIALLFLLKLTGVLKTSFTVTKTGQQGKSKPVVMEKEGVVFALPAGWYVSEQTPAGFVAALMSPQENSKDDFIENINIRKVDLSAQPDITLSQAADLWLTQTEAEYSAGGFNVLARNQVTIAGLPAAEFVYTVVDKDINGKGKSIVILKNKMAYVFNFVAKEESYDNFVNDVQSVFDSLQINE